jgi:hypothetical protein
MTVHVETDQAKVTTSEANEALQQLMGKADESEEPAAAEVEEQPAEAQEAEAETETEETVATEETVEESDDVASLNARLTELEENRKRDEERYKEQIAAQQQRFASSERILREKALQKSTVADRARQALERSLTDDGVDRGEVEKLVAEIRGTMHPESTSYTPPETHGAATEDQALVLNSFLNEKGMTAAEAQEFGNWINTEAATTMSAMEQAVAQTSLDGFLRLAEHRWHESKRAKAKEAEQTDAIGAVKSVQRAQREAARAASPKTTSPKKQPAAAAKAPDLSKLTNEEISDLFRQSVEQYQ